MAIVLEDDSLSEGSALSDADDDADAEGSEATDVDASERQDSKTKVAANGHKEVARQSTKTIKKPLFVAAPDTEAMMNGLQISDNTGEGEGVSFDDMTAQPSQPLSQSLGTTGDALSTAIDSPGERRRREHDEYKKKRDADPAFVPNRGGFFMHDHRSNAPGQNGFRPMIKGRGRGRGGFESSFAPVTYVFQPFISRYGLLNISRSSTQRSGPADAPWAHDLHESIAQPVLPNSGYQPQPFKPTMGEQTKTGSAEAKAPPPNRSFSRTSRIGNVQIRVYLAGMSDPIIFSTVPVNQHTRLPHHRPPLRRDKPVRIAIPNLPVRYIFPAMDRSFIFIPRALRPNQQGFGRSRGRGSFSGVGGFSSRRTSAFGGSNYSPSVTMSRRSSTVREIAPDAIISPIGSAVSRPLMADPSKPVVRLPPATEQVQTTRPQLAGMASVAPVVNLPQSQAYPSTQNPALRENRQGSIPMHQPRPQKTVSVAEIESPAFLDFNPPQQQQQQPFHQQVPAQVIGQTYQQDSSTYPHSRHPSHPSQASGGTPLPQIPERALQAMPFQAYPYQPSPNFYPPQYAPPVFFYPPAHTPTHSLPSAAAPSFIPGQQISYIMPAVAPTLPPPPPMEPTTQAGTVAHQSNGMVYYYDSSQLAATSTNSGESNAPYPPASYAIAQPGVLNVSGIPTPPMHYYPQPTAPIFYPPQ